jgi:hypothetical protein
MSVARQANLLGQQRLDIPHIRAIESSVAADFDLLAGEILAGKSPLVIHGFELSLLSTGTPATQLQLFVADSVILHPEASENGTIFQVPTSRAAETLNAANTRVVGSFTANTINYIGIDLRRTADPTTADLVQFLDSDTKLEKPKTVPLGRTLDYIIVISTQDFSTTPGVDQAGEAEDGPAGPHPRLHHRHLDAGLQHHARRRAHCQGHYRRL